MSKLSWNETDQRAVDTARVLAADAVEKVGNGHPGTAISLAPLAYLLYQKVMNTDPSDDRWFGRDRFLMSAGHASLTQYTQLYLAGLNMELEDIESLRTWGSKTPGHPEYNHTKFIESTTGPLGAGVSNIVGFAMAQRRERGMFDPDAPAGTSPFDYYVYAIAGDGCMQEGIASEASSLAGAQKLGNLIMFYDDNRITIEGETKIAFTEDVLMRYESYGWHTQHVDFTNGGTKYEEKVQELFDAIEKAKKVTDRPSFIKVTTVIGWPLPTLAGSHKVHGAALGATEISALKKELGFADEPFPVDEKVVEYTRTNAARRGAEARGAWDEKFAAWRKANPDRAKLFDRISSGELPKLDLPTFEEGKMSTRKASGKVLTALAPQLPELWGGSADLAGSNNTTMEGEPSFLPADQSSEEFKGTIYGRTLHFGVREHAMGGVLNGINVTSLTRAYGGTFLVFSDYMRGAIRLASLSKIPSLFVFTHDSIGVGEDGPTHQPIEQLASLRAIPNLQVVRPADANEVAVAWECAIRDDEHPTALILSRQDLPVYDRRKGYGAVANVARGAYVFKEASGKQPEVILIGTGSELQVCVDAAEQLEAQNIATRVVSMPCQEWFDQQDEDYREQILPRKVKARVSVEAGIEMGWRKYIGDQGAAVCIEHYGASASANKLFEEFGFTPAHVVQAARGVLGK